MLNALPGPSLRSEIPAGSDHHIARIAVVGLGVKADLIFRFPGRDLFVLGIAGDLVGIARLQLPAGVEFAGDLRLIAFGLGLGAHIGAVVARNRIEQRVG